MKRAIEIDGVMQIAPRTFKTHPDAYLVRLRHEVGNREPAFRGAVVAVTSQTIWEHIAGWVRYKQPIWAALMFGTGALVIETMPIIWTPEIDGELKLFRVVTDAPELVGKITNIVV